MSGSLLDPTGLKNVTLDPTQFGLGSAITANNDGSFTLSATGNADITSIYGASAFFGAKSGVPISFGILPVNSAPSQFNLSIKQSGAPVGGSEQADNVSILGWNADSILLQNFNTAGQTSLSYIVLSDIPLTDGTPNDTTFGTTGAAPFGLAATCFAQGTAIATPSGSAAVETLREGDLVCTLSGAAQPVVWAGAVSYDCATHPQPGRVMPVQVAPGAFGPGLPAQTLTLSPEHAVFMDGAMVPVRCLVNGATIRQVPAARIAYYHLELPRHDVVLAEGLPAETYLDTGNRQSLLRRPRSLAAAA